MKKFIITDDIFEIFPQMLIGIIVCQGIQNTYNNDEAEYEKMLKQAEKKAIEFLPNPEFTQNKVISVWREAFQQFKTKKGARCSIEALMKRIGKENSVRTINPIVDIYNSISLNYALPCGGEDLDKIVGDIKLTKATGDEDFLVLGSEESSSPYPGEIVYKDEAGAICRCWNWREAVRTMLTEETHNAFMCMELVDIDRKEIFIESLEDLRGKIENRLGATCRIELLDIKNKEMVIY
ncbi:MAG: B3/4 domain-containing protein [Anaerovoracaceae bacterium]